jgi:hypothetical protein
MGWGWRVAFDKLRLSGCGSAIAVQDPLMLSLSKHAREVAS